MTPRSPSVRTFPVALWFVFLLTIAQGSCAGGCTEVPYPTTPPAGGEVHQNAIALQTNQGLLVFLEKNIGPLIGSFLGAGDDGRAYFPIPASTGPEDSVRILEDSAIALDPQNLAANTHISWLPEDADGRPGLHLAIENAQLFLDVLFQTQISLFPDSACRIREASTDAALEIETLAFDLRVSVDDTADQSQLALDVENVVLDIAGLGTDLSTALEILPCDGTPSAQDGAFCQDPVCSSPDADCAEVCNLVDLFTELGGFVETIITPIIQTFTPTIGTMLSQTLEGSLSTLPLGFQSSIGLGTLAPEIFSQAAPLHAAVQMQEGPHLAQQDYAQGLRFTLDSGTAANAIAPCIVDATPPPQVFPATSPQWPNYTGFVEIPSTFDSLGNNIPSHLEAYHFAMGLSSRILSQAAYGLYANGSLCLNLDSATAASLSGGAFTISAGLLQTFDSSLVGLSPADAPALLAFRPSAAPTIHLGAAQALSDDFYEPLLTFLVEGIYVDIYMVLDNDAFHRIASLRTDLSLGLDIERDGDGALQFAINDLALTDIVQTYAEIAPNADLSEFLELAMDLATSAFVEDGLRFGVDPLSLLGDAIGGDLAFGIHRIRRDIASDGETYLSLYASLCDGDALSDPNNGACYRSGASGGRATDREFGLGLQSPAIASGHVDLQILGVAADEALMVQYRVDGSPWHASKPLCGDHMLAVENPRLKVPATHTIDIRLRDESGRIVLGQTQIQMDLAAAPASTDENSAPQIPGKNKIFSDTPAGGCQNLPVCPWLGLLFLLGFYFRRNNFSLLP